MLTSSGQSLYDKSSNLSLIKARVAPWVKETEHISHFKLAACGTCNVIVQFPKCAVFHTLFFCKAKRNRTFFLTWSCQYFNRGKSPCRNVGMYTISGNNIQAIEFSGVDLLLNAKSSCPEGHCSYQKLIYEEVPCITVRQLVHEIR